MTVKRLFVLAMAGAAALGVASVPAQAGYLVTGTITATIASGNDSSNIFGLNGASLAGYAMTLNYSYDTSLMSGSAASGMVNYTGSTPGIISATLTINGYTVVADGNSASGGGNGSFVSVNNSGGGKYYVATFLGSGNTLIGPQNFGSPGNWTPTTLNNPFSNLSAGGGGLYVNAGAGFDSNHPLRYEPVRVNTVNPGMVKTPLNENVWSAWNQQQPPEKKKTYEEWGIDKLVPKLRGMFAFAVWDQRRQRVVVRQQDVDLDALVSSSTFVVAHHDPSEQPGLVTLHEHLRARERSEFSTANPTGNRVTETYEVVHGVLNVTSTACPSSCASVSTERRSPV